MSHVVLESEFMSHQDYLRCYILKFKISNFSDIHFKLDASRFVKRYCCNNCPMPFLTYGLAKKMHPSLFFLFSN